MAQFVYNKGFDAPYITLDADDGEELSLEMAQAFALVQIGGALDVIGRATYELAEQVQHLSPIEVDLKK